MKSAENIVNQKSQIRRCTRCVMDTTAKNIKFDKNGICNFCTEFLNRSSHIIHENPDEKKERLNTLITSVKKTGRGKPYDCVVGVSGGVDSSCTLVKVKELGLRPLAVHMDNGWNSELAQNNIANLARNLDVDLFTYVIDWNEYRDLMQAFFNANVIDVELLYDNAMLAVNYRMAKKYKCHYILSGTNEMTEGMKMPDGWNHFKFDKTNITDIVKKNSNTKLSSFPAIGSFNLFKYRYLYNIKWISFLDYIDYNKEAEILKLEESYGYKRYPYKHYESIFTRFYQGYLLPEKFNVDKRKLHLSTLIMTGQITRDEVVDILKKPPYNSDKELEDDISYFLKKMKWDKKELTDYLNRNNADHQDFKNEIGILNAYRKIRNFLSL